MIIISTWSTWVHPVHGMRYNAKKIDDEHHYLRNRKLLELESELSQIGLKMLLSVDQTTYWKLLERFRIVSQELHLYDGE